MMAHLVASYRAIQILIGDAGDAGDDPMKWWYIGQLWICHHRLTHIMLGLQREVHEA